MKDKPAWLALASAMAGAFLVSTLFTLAQGQAFDCAICGFAFAVNVVWAILLEREIERGFKAKTINQIILNMAPDDTMSQCEMKDGTTCDR